jgi:phenylalanyl-tRNA synthetase beta subunit
MIKVQRIGEGEFETVVSDGSGETRHHVSMTRATYERLTGGKYTPETCVEAAFRFLLDREPKESILARFDVTVIARYFPEFEQELPRYLSRSDVENGGPR